MHIKMKTTNGRDPKGEKGDKIVKFLWQKSVLETDFYPYYNF